MGRRNSRSTRGAFTLIELLVVISIVALLSSVVMASLNSARAKARDATRKSTVGQVYRALQAYYSDNGSYPSTGGDDSRACLGRASSQSCVVGSTSVSGQNALQTALSPYIAQVPLDPYPNRSGTPSVAEGYLYSGRCDITWTGGSPSYDNRPCVIWFPEETPSAASCLPGVRGSSSSAVCGSSCNFCAMIVDN